MEESPLHNLPDELVWDILSRLEPRQIITSSLVCKRFHGIVNRPALWRDIRINANELGASFLRFLEKFPEIHSVCIKVEDVHSLSMLKGLRGKTVKKLIVDMSLQPFDPDFTHFHRTGNVSVTVTESFHIRFAYDDFWLSDNFTCAVINKNSRTLRSISIVLSNCMNLPLDILEQVATCQKLEKLCIPAPSVHVAFVIPHLLEVILHVDVFLDIEKMRHNVKGHNQQLKVKGLSIVAIDGSPMNDVLYVLSGFFGNVERLSVSGACWESEALSYFLSSLTLLKSVTLSSRSFTAHVLYYLLHRDIHEIHGDIYVSASELQSVRETLEQTCIQLNIYHVVSRQRIWDWTQVNDLFEQD